MLELGTPVEVVAEPLKNEDFITALHIQEDANDQAGFAALRRALADRNTNQLIQAAQDVLNLLSQDGIYMDDLRPDMARPETWRRFAQGERGRTIAALGGIRDRSSLALTNVRMKKDPVFRDAAHHFCVYLTRGLPNSRTPQPRPRFPHCQKHALHAPLCYWGAWQVRLPNIYTVRIVDPVVLRASNASWAARMSSNACV